MASCNRNDEANSRISPASVYANDTYIAGAGYYHAPFHAFYPRPYNFYDAGTHQYFYGGSWNAAPHRSVINVSAPTPEASVIAEQGRALIQRNGFGSTSHSYFRGS